MQIFSHTVASWSYTHTFYDHVFAQAPGLDTAADTLAKPLGESLADTDSHLDAGQWYVEGGLGWRVYDLRD